MISTAMESGLGTMLDDLRRVELSDSEIRRFARHKVSDDASAMLLRVD